MILSDYPARQTATGGDPKRLDEIAEIVEQERGCCQLLKFHIIVEPSNGPIYLNVTGPAGTREMFDAL